MSDFFFRSSALRGTIARSISLSGPSLPSAAYPKTQYLDALVPDQDSRQQVESGSPDISLILHPQQLLTGRRLRAAPIVLSSPDSMAKRSRKQEPCGERGPAEGRSDAKAGIPLRSASCRPRCSAEQQWNRVPSVSRRLQWVILVSATVIASQDDADRSMLLA